MEKVYITSRGQNGNGDKNSEKPCIFLPRDM